MYRDYKKIPDINATHNIIHIDDSNGYEGKSQNSSSNNLSGFNKVSHQDYFIIEIDNKGKVEIKTLSPREILFQLQTELSTINESALNESTIIQVSKLMSRDIRRLDPLSSDAVILIRKHAILMCVDFKGIITAEKIRLVCPAGSDTILKTFSERIVEWTVMLNPDMSWESHCYEVLITMGLASINQEYKFIKSQAISLLSQFKKTDILDISTQEALRLLKNKVSNLIGQVKACRQAFISLLDEEDDIEYMSLTLLKLEPLLYSQNVRSTQKVYLSKKLLEEKEGNIVMMENYSDEYNTLLSQIIYISYELQNAEEVVMLRLDVSRNQLLIADTKLSVVSVALAFGSFISSMFGMNLVNHFESNSSGFLTVFLLTTITSIIVVIGTILHFKRTNVIPK